MFQKGYERCFFRCIQGTPMENILTHVFPACRQAVRRLTAGPSSPWPGGGPQSHLGTGHLGLSALLAEPPQVQPLRWACAGLPVDSEFLDSFSQVRVQPPDRVPMICPSEN